MFKAAQARDKDRRDAGSRCRCSTNAPAAGSPTRSVGWTRTPLGAVRRRPVATGATGGGGRAETRQPRRGSTIVEILALVRAGR